MTSTSLLAGRYRAISKIGEGASAEVWRARDEQLRREVALKLLRPQFLADPTARARFIAEARAAGALAHPHVVAVYDFGEGADGTMYIAMQYVPGPNLKEWLQGRVPLAASEAIGIARQVAGALAVAHARSLIHRDVKPQNILLQQDGSACLSDFGIVKALDGPALTQAGMTFGTAPYMAPEQVTGGPLSPATDIYSLGCVIYEMLAGAPPFGGDSSAAVAYQQVWEAPLPLGDVAPQVPPALVSIVMRCLEKDPIRRYPTAGDLIRAFDAVSGPAADPTQALPRGAGAHAGAVPGTWQPLVPPPADHNSPPPPIPSSGAQAPAVQPNRKVASMKANAAPPTFQRAPRLRPDLPQGEVEIPAPPTVPAAPATALLPILLPALFAVGMLFVLLFAMRDSSGSPLLIIMSVGFMGVASATSFIGFFSQQRSHKRTGRERQTKYRQLLQNRHAELSKFREQQQLLLDQSNPDPQECVARVERRDRRLWERSPQDADFLALRLGLAAQPSTIGVKAPKQDDTLEPDPLIQEAQQLAGEFAQVPDLPLLLPLRQVGAVGLAGARPAVLNAARALAVQIATHHAPDEVKIAAIFPADEADDWDWLRWLPHTWTEDRRQRLLASDKDAAHRLLVSLYDDWLNRRLLYKASGQDTQLPPPLPYLVVFLADPRLAEHEPAIPLLLGRDPALGASPVFLADRIEALPKGCHGIVELSSGRAQRILTAPVATQTVYQPDDVPRAGAERLARALAPLHLQRLAGPSEITATVPLLDLLGASRVEDLDVAARWRTSEPAKSLAVPLGRRVGNEILAIDLHERGHGPHGLAAGATGSGKSELLQALVAALAVQFHPHQVTFVLIDYKGGGMANAFQDLPHLVGTITNLQGNLAGRALAALKSEMQRRQTLLGQAGVKHIDEYQDRYRQGAVREPLPHLIIIADEFAELVAEQPDFMKELISAVRVGRSLGVHLLLATQKPAGVVNEQIWGNARFRLCLRVERPEDSREVLKRADAASLTQPGRAYFQVGNNEIFELFQAAWGGAMYNPDGAGAVDPEEIVEVALDGTRRVLSTGQGPAKRAAGATQLQAIVACITAVADQEGIQRLPGPWLPPLPEQVMLDQVRPSAGWDGQTWQPAGSWLAPVVGLLDDPVHQYQGPLALNLGKDGHLLIYGAPGSGKTTFLQTLIISLALAHAPADVHLYLLDFGGRSLNVFAPLPHVGGVVMAEESERIQRLLRWLLREMDGRKDRFAQAGVNTLAAYRAATAVPLPAIVVALDNYTGFAGAYQDLEDLLGNLAREGGNLGIHLVLTANGSMAIKSKISGNFTLAVALQMADKSEYSVVIGRLTGPEPAALPGRGLVRGKPPLEFQTALPTAGDTDAARTAALRTLVAQMAQAWTGPRARPVPMLRDAVPLCEVLPPGDTWAPPTTPAALIVPFLVDVDDLEPIVFDLMDGAHFLVTGPVQSGKTTLLQSWLLALSERYPPEQIQLYLVDFRRSGLLPLRRLPHVHAYIANDKQLGEALAEIARALPERRQAWEDARQAGDDGFDEPALLARYPAIVVAIDDLDAVSSQAQAASKELLEQFLRRERGLGVHLLVAGGINDWQSYDGWIRAIKELQTGFVLGSSDAGDVGLLNVRLPYGEAGKPTPPGQGFYGRRGRFRKIKVATAQAGATRLPAWVERLTRRAPGNAESGDASGVGGDRA